MTRKIWFAGISGPGSLENLKELLEPIKQYFEGIVWVLHDSVGHAEDTYLQNINADVIHYHYNQRHNESRNQYLWNGPIQQDDWVCTCDDLERVVPAFAKDLHNLIDLLEAARVTTVYYYGKVLLFKYHESCRFDGTPHESFRRQDGSGVSLELSANFPDEKDIRVNMRPVKRTDPFHWVDHYCRYMLFPWGSNHSLLGLENRSTNVTQAFQIRESKRLGFIAEIRKRGYTVDLNGLRAMLSVPLDATMKKFLNEEKVWQDFYRYHILDDKKVQDEHSWTSMIKL